MSGQLQRAVEVMDRLRSPGGCPWDAAQTHESLTRYLLEETYEVLEAIETGDLALLREELGDLLLQVLFHARLAQELPPEQAFGIDDVAGDLVAKLVRRHPHVFANVAAGDAEALNEAWEKQKIAEKGRTSAVDGVPLAQPALALAAKLIARAQRAGLDPTSSAPVAPPPSAPVAPPPSAASGDLPPRVATNFAPLDPETRHSIGEAGEPGGVGEPREAGGPGEAAEPLGEREVGERLFALAREAVAAGVDPEAALRRATRAYRDAIVAAESAGVDR